jgi:hypothetical protein
VRKRGVWERAGVGSIGGTGRGARLLTVGDVEDEEGEGVAVLRRPGAPEVRHRRRRRWRPGGKAARGLWVWELGRGEWSDWPLPP